MINDFTKVLQDLVLLKELLILFSIADSNRAVSNRWTGLLEWTTEMDFDLFFFFFSQELTLYIEELV